MKPYSRRWQEMILVLYALNEMSGFQRKRDVLEWIEEHRLINPCFMGRNRYESCSEPKYRTLLCWGRKDNVIRGLLFNEERDCWGVTRDGRTVVEKIMRLGVEGELQIHRCFLWSVNFKRIINPAYAPSKRDWEHADDYLREILL